MAGVPVIYPDTLPHPQVGQFTPRERRAINREVMRPISRDRAGVRSVAFIFTPDQASEFREWYAEWLSMGGGFFAAPWPMPWGRGPHVFRFAEPPSWQLVGGALNGQGYWRVTADVELRGRGDMPELEVLIITSKLYPMEIAEDVTTSSPAFFKVEHPFQTESVELSVPTFVAGTLRDPLVQLTYPADQVKLNPPAFIAGTIREPLVEIDAPADEVKLAAPSFESGTLRVILIQYTNWTLLAEDEESVTLTPPNFISGTLS